MHGWGDASTQCIGRYGDALIELGARYGRAGQCMDHVVD